MVEARAPHAVAEVRKRFGRSTARSFQPWHEELELVTAACAAPLGVASWSVAVVPVGDALLAAAQAIVADEADAKRSRAQHSRQGRA